MRKQPVPSIRAYDNTILRLNLSPSFYDSSYEKYWEGKNYGFDYIELSGREKDEMNVLYLLELLGFPMDETGTFLYKEMIVEASRELKNSGVAEKKMIKSAMANPYSQFLFYLNVLLVLHFHSNLFYLRKISYYKKSLHMAH